jgi:hypothetical protein
LPLADFLLSYLSTWRRNMDSVYLATLRPFLCFTISYLIAKLPDASFLSEDFTTTL